MSRQGASTKHLKPGKSHATAAAGHAPGAIPVPAAAAEHADVRTARRSGSPGPRRGRFRRLDVFVFALAAAAAVVFVNILANRGEWRWYMDATKTRAYSLSDRTKTMMADLSGEWTLALIMSRGDVDNATARRQVREVLKRFAEASPSVNIVEIDPGSGESLVRFDALLTQLTSRERSEIEKYDSALRDGLAELDAVRRFAAELTPRFQELLANVRTGDALSEQLAAQAGRFAGVAQEGRKITEQVNTSLAVTEDQPLPDYETARSVLAAVLAQWANEVADLVRTGRQIAQRTDLSQTVQMSSKAMFDQTTLGLLSQKLAITADVLKRLPELDVSSVARQLSRGEALLVMSPARAVIIPSAQLFPKSNVKAAGRGGISFDQRFKGEQVIAAAMQSLLVPTMPRVVFVHGEERSLLAPDANRVDLRAISLLLKTARYSVAEWNTANQPQRPTFEDRAPLVWVLVPPQVRKSLDPTQGERNLLSAVKALIDEGENVLLSFHPSLLPKYGQTDPWSQLTRGLGFTPQTQHIIVERAQVAQDQVETQRGLALASFPQQDPIARSLQDLPTYFALPVPMAVDTDELDQATAATVVEVAPTRERSLDKDWLAQGAKPDAQGVSTTPLEKPVALAVTLQRPRPQGDGSQRIAAVGSGSWMLSFVADVALADGAGRMVLTYPGNQQLMLSSVAWLAGHEELIGSAAGGRDVAHLTAVSTDAQRFWGWMVIAGVPCAVLLIGFVVWVLRRF